MAAVWQAGLLLDLTPMFKRDMKLDDFIPSSAQIMDINGKVFGNNLNKGDYYEQN